MRRAQLIAIKLYNLAGKSKRRTLATSQTSSLTQTRCRSTWNFDNRALQQRNVDLDAVVSKLEMLQDVDVRIDGTSIMLIPAAKRYRALLQIVEKVKAMVIKGVEDIKRVVVRKEHEEYVLYTEGSSLKKVIVLEHIDYARTKTNNINENVIVGQPIRLGTGDVRLIAKTR